MNRKRLIIAAAAAAVILLIAGGALAWRLLTRKPAPVALTFVHPLERDTDIRALNQVLGEFTSLYPNITVRALSRDPSTLRGAGLLDGAGARADVIVATGPAPAGSAVWASPPFQWTGTLWVLAARRDVLEKAGVSEQAQALREGRMSPAGFIELLSALSSRGLVPLTLGNSHRWPFLIWLQHWAAATSGREAVQTLPSGHAAQDKGYLERLKPAYDTLAGWKAKGWFHPAAWKEGWARGLQPLAQGKAVFSLLSPLFLSALPEEARKDLEFFPFPGSRDPGRAWTIGSVYLLGASRASPRPKEAALLATYLTSPGVTQILSRRIGRPFFSWSSEAGTPPTVIADWYSAANTPEMKELEDAFGVP